MTSDRLYPLSELEIRAKALSQQCKLSTRELSELWGGRQPHFALAEAMGLPQWSSTNIMKCSNSIGRIQGVTTTLSQERELAIHHWLESEGYFMYWWYLAIQVPLVPVPLASCLGSLSSNGGEGGIAAYSVKKLPPTDLHHLSFAHCEFYPTFFTRAGSHVTWCLS